MCLELKIEELTKAIVALTAKIDAIQADHHEAAEPVPLPASIPVVTINPEAPIPVITPEPAPEPAAPVMPAPPAFIAAAPPVPPSSSVLFRDGKGLIEYVMTAYKQLGPERGAGIQTVLNDLGAQNVNDVNPEQYVDFYNRVEALK